MISFQQFLRLKEEQYNVSKEWSSEKLENEEARNLLASSMFSWAMDEFRNDNNEHRLLFRGDKRVTSPLLVNPGSGIRASRGTNNLYQLLMNESPHLREYPKRTSAMIASPRNTFASTFGPVSVVIPKKGSKVAKIKKIADFFDTPFRTSELGEMRYIRFCDGISSFLEELGVIRRKWDRMDSLDGLDQIIKEVTNSVYTVTLSDNLERYFRYAIDREDYDQLQKFLLKNKDHLIKSIIDLLTPQSLGLSLFRAGDKIEDDGECWFSEPALIMPTHSFDEI